MAMASPVMSARIVVRILKNLDDIHDFMSCARVCRQWRRIVQRILLNVKYLVKRHPDHELDPGSTATKQMNTLYYTSPIVLSYWHLSELVPNLSILDMAGHNKLWLTHEDAEAMLTASESLRGLIYRLGDILDFYVVEGAPFLLNLSIYYLSPKEARYFSEVSLMQLHTEECFLDSLFSHSLIRLHIGYTLGGTYDGCYLDNLKILEINTLVTDDDGHYKGFSLINRCPNLQSLYLKIDGIQNRFTFTSQDVSYNGNVRDLVIESPYCEWKLIRRILNKFPRIKNLAIRENFRIHDSCVPEIIDMLPNITLIDLRGCYNITRDAEAFVINHRGNSPFPTFYYEQDNRILREWRNLHTTYERIIRGFSFMKYCFIKTFDHLPYLMDQF
ncbi:uncharacterized protein LOC107370007 isoform X1 [Tetranychus urticae]|uniref:uncharacterized protein LOC107370007 isoform X1 n=2 Tax=Tetranychus urticae TaxID=32264 RepID=UPI00077BF43F|nr:uncharacterized protein LOC107370007 isoform X1 [Tetranychus urticae]